MTIPEFIERLNETPATWQLVGTLVPRLRCADQTCPIVAVAGETGSDAWEYFAVLGLTPRDGWAIVDAADGEVREEDYDAVLRRQLLAATVERTA